MDEGILSPDMETHNLFADDMVASYNPLRECFSASQGTPVRQNHGFQSFGHGISRIASSQESPFMKDCFKPRKIRRSRSYLNPTRISMEIDTDENILRRKKQRNSFSSLSDITNDTIYNGSVPFVCSEKENTSPFCNGINSPKKTSFSDLTRTDRTVFLTPTREDLSLKCSRINVETQVNHILNLNIKLFAIDFDQTLLSIHTKGVWRKTATCLAQYVRPVFKALLPPLLRKGVIVAIVTFSPQLDLVERVLNVTFKECFLGKNMFICGGEVPMLKARPSKFREFGTQLSVKMFFPSKNMGRFENCQGKCSHLSLLLDELAKKKKGIKHNEVLFVDDDAQNVSLCQQKSPLIMSLIFRSCNSEVESENWFLNSILQL